MSQKFKQTKPTYIKLLYQMLYDIHCILELYDVRYYMVGETMLGAFKHGGIIPWNDKAELGINKFLEKRFLETKKSFKKCGYNVVSTFFGYKISRADRKNVEGCNYSFPFVDIFMFKPVKGFLKPVPKVPKEIEKIKMDVKYDNGTKGFDLVPYKFGIFPLWGMENADEYLKSVFGSDYMSIGKMEGPAKPFDKVKNTRCVYNLTRKKCEIVRTGNYILT